MTRPVAALLQDLLGEVDEAAEPDTAKIHSLLGLQAPCIASSAEVCGISGVCAPASCQSPRYSVALQPLRGLPRSYRAPRVERAVAEALRELSKLGKSAPVFTDYTDRARGRRCRARLGCSPTALQGKIIEAGEQLGLGAANPRLIAPQLLAPRTLRVTRRRILEAPWLAVQTRPGSCASILCLSERCTMAVEPGVLEALEGRLVLEESRSCSPTRLAIDSSMTTANASDARGLYALGPLLPLWASVKKAGRNAILELLVWNPAPRSYLAVLVTPGYRVRLARASHSLSEGWEMLVPEYDRVRLPVRRFGLALLRLELVELPPLLRR